MKNYLNQIIAHVLINIVYVPTRLNNLGGTLIDQLFVHDYNKLLSIMSDIYDNFPLYIKLNHCKVKKTV